MPWSAGHSFLKSRKRTILPVRSLAAAFLIFWGSLVAVQAEVTNRIVAVVNNEIITWLELEREDGTTPSTGNVPPGGEIQKQILFRMIDQKLLDAQIRKLNLQVGKEEIDKAVSRIQSDQGLKTPEEFAAALAREGINEEELRGRLKDLDFGFPARSAGKSAANRLFRRSNQRLLPEKQIQIRIRRTPPLGPNHRPELRLSRPGGGQSQNR